MRIGWNISSTIQSFIREATSGQIVLESPYEILTYEIVVEKDVCRDEERREQDKEFASILKRCLVYESGKLDLNTWCEESLKEDRAFAESG